MDGPRRDDNHEDDGDRRRRLRRQIRRRQVVSVASADHVAAGVDDVADVALRQAVAANARL